MTTKTTSICAAGENGMDDCTRDHVARGVACETCQARALTRGGAVVSVRDVIEVRIEMRAPKAGELGWCVDFNADAATALRQVIAGRGIWSDGESGFGWLAADDQPDIEPGILGCNAEGRNITVIVTHLGVESGTEVVL